ncbi:MAG: glycosyltransferase family 2 protein [Phycisphaeraceae bacterium]|nr:glycosyltransferase family 2 protein [Phycisphaeraceae bacterium]
MHVSVLIPTFARSDKLARCLASLARQSFDASKFEVIVGFDGPDPRAEAAARETWESCGGKAHLDLVALPRSGYTIVRNQILARATGRLLVSLNDDVRPAPDFLDVHTEAHAQRKAQGKEVAIIVGASPFCRRENETLLDRLVQSTSMIFFYDAMDRERDNPDRDWGFRHCFGLNFSADLAMVREVGGFLARPHLYGYDDIELGFRLCTRFGLPVLYRPQALAPHDHFYEPADILSREHNLGVAAWHFARANPAFAKACFGRDICHPDELAYSLEFIARERSVADRIRESFLQLSNIPGCCFDGDHQHALLQMQFQQFVLLKRWIWRTGLLEAAGIGEARIAA